MNNTSSLAPSNTMMAQTPDQFCLLQSFGEGRTPLNAFDHALIGAGIGDVNLVRMSSIIPPGALSTKIENLSFSQGALVPAAYALINSAKPGELISAAIAVGIPEDETQAGVIMEHADHGKLTSVESAARQMVEDAFTHRNRALGEILSTGAEHRVKDCGAAFAGVILWYE